MENMDGLTMEQYKEMKNKLYKLWFSKKDDEYKQHLRENYKKWIERQSIETLNKYKAKKSGSCEICHHHYSDLYQHRQTKKHIKNAGNSTN